MEETNTSVCFKFSALIDEAPSWPRSRPHLDTSKAEAHSNHDCLHIPPMRATEPACGRDQRRALVILDQSDCGTVSQCRPSLWKAAKTWQTRKRSLKHLGGEQKKKNNQTFNQLYLQRHENINNQQLLHWIVQNILTLTHTFSSFLSSFPLPAGWSHHQNLKSSSSSSSAHRHRFFFMIHYDWICISSEV